jgi:hypothetical protein
LQGNGHLFVERFYYLVSQFFLPPTRTRMKLDRALVHLIIVPQATGAAPCDRISGRL